MNEKILIFLVGLRSKFLIKDLVGITTSPYKFKGRKLFPIASHAIPNFILSSSTHIVLWESQQTIVSS